MKKLAMFFFTVLSLSAQAETFKCTFTEPFIDVTYNTDTQVLTETMMGEEVLAKVKNVSFQIKYAGTFLLKNKAGKTLVELKLNNNGSDGMSDAIYPYEGTFFGTKGDSERGLVGGCISSLKPMVKEPN